jgi:hypothetical protein
VAPRWIQDMRKPLAVLSSTVSSARVRTSDVVEPSGLVSSPRVSVSTIQRLPTGGLKL